MSCDRVLCHLQFWYFPVNSVVFVVELDKKKQYTRTYPCGTHVTGIQFLYDWLNQRWSLRLGYWTARTIQKTTLKLEEKNRDSSDTHLAASCYSVPDPLTSHLGCHVLWPLRGAFHVLPCQMHFQSLSRWNKSFFILPTSFINRHSFMSSVAQYLSMYCRVPVRQLTRAYKRWKYNGEANFILNQDATKGKSLQRVYTGWSRNWCWGHSQSFRKKTDQIEGYIPK